MYDIDKRLRKFYKDEVAIDSAMRQKLRDARKANEKRLEHGLAAAGRPAPARHVPQGGYAMKTVVQQDDNKYDIDNGVVFTLHALKGLRNADMAPLDARKMVCGALEDKRFNKQPEVRKHCVRVYYDEGWWVDVPVYREVADGTTGETHLEIASEDWKLSDPVRVTAWFQQLEQAKSPDLDAGGDPQFRRIVAYIKALSKGRSSWRWPTGFMISVLVSESYHADARDDIALRETLKAIRSRLRSSTMIYHPVLTFERLDRGDWLSKDSRCVEMCDKLGELLAHLNVLDQADCGADDAARAWDSVYGVTYFKDALTETAVSPATAFGSFAGATLEKFHRGDGGRYGDGGVRLG